MEAVQLYKDNQAPANLRYLPLQDGDDFQSARSQPKIGAESDEYLKEALRYFMLILGAKEKDLPSGVEKDIWINVIKKKHAGLTAKEIRLAAEKAVARELDLEESEIKTYGNFSLEYYFRIMNAYLKWSRKEYAIISTQTEKISIAISNATEINWRDSAQKAYKDFLNGSLNIRTMVKEIYVQIEKDELISINYFDHFVKKAKHKMCSDLQTGILFSKLNRRDEGAEIGGYNTSVNLENELVRLHSSDANSSIILYAMQLAVEYYFKYLHSKKFTELYSLTNNGENL